MEQHRTLDLTEALSAADAALVSAKDDPAAIAIVDRAGDVVFAVRNDGATQLDMRVALRTAYTAAVLERDSERFAAQLTADGRRLADWADPCLTTLPGGIVVCGEAGTVGALGFGGAARRRTEVLDAALAALDLELA